MYIHKVQTLDRYMRLLSVNVNYFKLMICVRYLCKKISYIYLQGTTYSQKFSSKTPYKSTNYAMTVMNHLLVKIIVSTIQADLGKLQISD